MIVAVYFPGFRPRGLNAKALAPAFPFSRSVIDLDRIEQCRPFFAPGLHRPSTLRPETLPLISTVIVAGSESVRNSDVPRFAANELALNFAPEITGGGGGAITVEAADIAFDDPNELAAVTIARTRCPTSAAVNRYVDFEAPAMFEQLVPDALQSCQAYANDVGLWLQLPFVAESV